MEVVFRCDHTLEPNQLACLFNSFFDRFAFLGELQLLRSLSFVSITVDQRRGMQEADVQSIRVSDCSLLLLGLLLKRF